MVRETVDRLRQSQEENEMVTRRRDELEARVAALETEYEELLGQCLSCGKNHLRITDTSVLFYLFVSSTLTITEKTIHDEETSDVDLAESMSDLKVRRNVPYLLLHSL